MVHLYTLGFRGEDLINFDLSLNNPSRLAELQTLEYLRTKFDTAGSVPEGTYSKRWVASNILGLSDEEFLRNQRESFYDRKWQQELEAVSEQAAVEEGGLGDAGELGDLGDLGAEDLGELGGEDLAALPGEPEGGEDDSALLTAPARRDEDGPRGPRDGRTYGGPFRRETRSSLGPELNTDRKNKGSGIGNPHQDMSLAALGYSSKRRQESIYSKSERRLIENTVKVRRLVEQLEKKEADKDET